MAFSVIYDQNYGEPKPRKYHAIKCWDCKILVANKTEAGRNHKGHSVGYVLPDGSPDNG